MNAFRQTCAAVVIAVGSVATLPAAFAAGPSGSTGSTYQSERAMCGHINQDKAACIREAGAAAQAARQGNLTSASDATYRQNALARCQAQPIEDRTACEQRITGAGQTTIDGSVLGGGAIRETVTTTTVPMQAPMPMPMPAPSTLN